LDYTYRKKLKGGPSVFWGISLIFTCYTFEWLVLCITHLIGLHPILTDTALSGLLKIKGHSEKNVYKPESPERAMSVRMG
jgi:hypothetical protein